MDKLDEIISLLKEIRDNTKPKQKRERTSVVGEGLPQIANLWNQWAHESLPKIMSMDTSSTRYKQAVQRWKEHPRDDFWIRVIQRMNQSTFCLGQNDKKWVADIEFLVRPDTCNKILEGKYDNKTGKVFTPERRVAGYLPNGDPVFETVKGK